MSSLIVLKRRAFRSMQSIEMQTGAYIEFPVGKIFTLPNFHVLHAVTFFSARVGEFWLSFSGAC